MIAVAQSTDFLTTSEFARSTDEYYRPTLESYPKGHYVYVVKDMSVSGYYKIGKTSEPHKRLTRFGILLPFEICIISILPCANAAHLEKVLHEDHRHQRVRGEWFDLTGLDIGNIKWLERYLGK